MLQGVGVRIVRVDTGGALEVSQSGIRVALTRVAIAGGAPDRRGMPVDTKGSYRQLRQLSLLLHMPQHR